MNILQDIKQLTIILSYKFCNRGNMSLFDF